MTREYFLTFLCVGLTVVTFGAAAQVRATPASDGWPHQRGPNLDGAIRASLEIGDGIALRQRWRVDIGSGYSGIAVSNGRALTMFTDGASDLIAAFDLETGNELWRHRIDSINKGRDGSDDGPLSTPLIFDDKVYVLGAKGQLVALAFEDGKVHWQKRLQSDFESTEPSFGFGTTPLASTGHLIVAVGGPEDRSIAALDPDDGSVVWTSGTGVIEYQTPISMTLAGREQIVAISDKHMFGIDPSDGDVLWRHDFGEKDWVNGATPTTAGENRILVIVSGEAVVFEVSQTEGVFAANELYRTNALGRTYALPVFSNGYLYGFRGQILTCINAETGERVWRSRPPGGRGLILIDDKLAIFGADGNVVLADASPQGYVERGRLQALGQSSYTAPSYANGKLLVRNLEEMAAIELSAGRKSTLVSNPRSSAGDFGMWVARLEQSENKAELIAEFLTEHEQSPILEGDRAHFVFQGEVEDLAISGSMLPTTNPEAMNRVGGTDFYYRTYQVEPGVRWQYHFVKDFGEEMPDPRNLDQVPSGFGSPMSQFTTAGYKSATHVAEPTGPRGRIDELTLESKVQSMKRELRVYTPPGYGDGEDSYPLLLVHDGFAWLEKGLMANSLDNLIGRSIQPIVVAFLKPQDEWWLEAGGTGTGKQVEMIVGELLPFLGERYRLTNSGAAHAAMGQMGYGMTSAYLALHHPDIFGAAAIQSPQIDLGSFDRIAERLTEGQKLPVRFYLDWNRYDPRDLDAGFDLLEESTRFARLLTEQGYEFTGGEMADSFGWAGWRSRTDRMLETLFPLDR